MVQERMRFDSVHDSNRPTRAEFFYPRAIDPGPPTPDTHIDYQEVTTYLEVPFRPMLSAFLEAPVRFVNPEINPNTAGFSDRLSASSGHFNTNRIASPVSSFALMCRLVTPTAASVPITSRWSQRCWHSGACRIACV
jgi:hypothetical protein